MSVLAVVPARGGSKGLPRKNVRPFAGLPLIAHALRLAELCPQIDRTIVSTDDEEIARVAREHGGDVPFLRPHELAQDETGMWPVLRHALAEVGDGYDRLLLLDPTAPTRLAEDVAGALAALEARPDADGVVSVCEPAFSIVWESVVERDGWLEQLFPDAARYERRQDVPRALRINGAVYAWRTSFVRAERDSWLNGRHVAYEMPELRSGHVDTEDELLRLEALVAAGLIRLPWLP